MTQRTTLYATVVLLLAGLMAAGVNAEPQELPAPVQNAVDKAWIVEQVYDEAGELIWETGIEPSNPLIWWTKHYAKPGGGTDPGTDCESDTFKLGGWHWNAPYSGFSTQFASSLSQSGGTWDQATGASIMGGIGSGSRGTAGQFDGVNQIDFVNLGGGGTIAVTTTWYYRGSGEAVESDGQYNTFYAWSTSGAANAMDVQNIGTHEIGHTFGLLHPNGPGVSCLTMYAYGDFGETQKRTLGDGDILGIRAIYGA